MYIIIVAITFFCTLMGFAAPGAASTVKLSYLPGTIYQIPVVQGSNPTGANMAGMEVTVDYTYKGLSESTVLDWQKTGSKSGGVSFSSPGGTISLSENGVTSSGTWSFKSAKGIQITDISMDSTSGNIVFDIPLKKGNTKGSNTGQSFSLLSAGTGLKFQVTYSNLVELQSAKTPVGDLYEALNISVSGSTGKSATQFTFRLGADRADGASPVPVPSSLMLICSGILSLLGIRRRL
jgi:hypothetical protein